MQIGFVKMGHPDPNISSWAPIGCMARPDFNGKDNKHQFCTVSPSMYYTIQGLRYNQTFNKYLKLFREELGIPATGLSWDDYLRLAKESRDFEPQSEEDEFIDPQYGYEILNLHKKYRNILHMHNYLELAGYTGYNNWDLLVLFGLVEPILDDPITWQIRNAENMYSSAQFNPFCSISINIHRQVSRHELVSYINDNFIEINKIMKTNLLPSLPKTKVILSKEDLDVLEAVASGKTYNKILDSWEKENEEKLQRGEITEEDIPVYSKDQLRMAYKRAKQRVNTLFFERKQE